MSNKFIILFIFFGSAWCGFSQKVSQKVGVNPTIIAPSAALEVESTTKGFLPPRMTFAQRNAIQSPVTGLMIYCSDCNSNGELQIFNGAIWTNSIGGIAGSIVCGAPTSTGGFLVFKCHNLGADESADPLIPSWRLNGAYFQWGRKPVTISNGYIAKPNSGIEGFAAAPTGPGAGEANDGSIAGWNTTAAPNGAWNITEGSPLKTANDPCPSGYRIPTRNEWVSIYSPTPINTQTNWSNVGTFGASSTSYSYGRKVNNTLYLPASGLRTNSNGALSMRGSFFYYWSSTESSTTSSYTLFWNGGALMDPENSNDRNFGFSVRCVAE